MIARILLAGAALAAQTALAAAQNAPTTAPTTNFPAAAGSPPASSALDISASTPSNPGATGSRPAASQGVAGPNETGAVDRDLPDRTGGFAFYQPRETDVAASKLRGVDLYNPRNDELGEVEDVILDQNRTVRAYVVRLGGFLGMGERRLALESSMVVMEREADGDLRAVTTIPDELLKKAPEYNDRR